MSTPSTGEERTLCRNGFAETDCAFPCSECGEYPPCWVKRPHARGCPGTLVNRHERVHVDRIGRIDNGGIVAHVYSCNMRWSGCKAKVLIAERSFRSLAVAALPDTAPTGRDQTGDAGAHDDTRIEGQA